MKYKIIRQVHFGTEIDVYETLPFSSIANMVMMFIFEVMFVMLNVHRKSVYVIVIYTKQNATIIIVSYVDLKMSTVRKKA